MEKIFLLIAALVCVAPGCKKKDAGKQGHDKTVRIKREKKEIGKKNGERSLFLDDNVQEFVFEEEAGTDAFSSGFIKDTSSVKLVEPAHMDDRGRTDRHTDQSQYSFKTIYFGYDRFSIHPNQKAALEHDLDSVKRITNKGKTVVVEGHSCRSAGSAVYNMLLSEKRAQSVAKYLVDNGVPVDQLKVVGRGNEMCIVPVGTREQQAPNRRVELYVL